MKIEIEATDMSEITPDTKIKMSLKDWVITLLALLSFAWGGLNYFGVIPNKASGQDRQQDCVTKSELENKYATKEKMQDTINLTEQKMQTLSKEIETLSRKQDRMDDKIDKILDKLRIP